MLTRSYLQPPPSFQPPLPPTSAPTQPAAPPRPPQPDLITRYNLASKVSAEKTSDSGSNYASTKAPSWSSNKEERQDLLKRRREEMILKARRKMEEKDRSAAWGDLEQMDVLCLETWTSHNGSGLISLHIAWAGQTIDSYGVGLVYGCKACVECDVSQNRIQIYSMPVSLLCAPSWNKTPGRSSCNRKLVFMNRPPKGFLLHHATFNFRPTLQQFDWFQGVSLQYWLSERFPPCPEHRTHISSLRINWQISVTRTVDCRFSEKSASFGLQIPTQCHRKIRPTSGHVWCHGILAHSG